MTLTSAFQANDVWQVTLSDGNTPLGTGTASGTNLDTVALNLATSISAITGFEAVSKGSTVAITRTAGGTLTVTLSVSPADSMSIAATAMRFVTYANNETTAAYRPGTLFSSGTQADTAHVVSALVAAINASTGTAFAAVAMAGRSSSSRAAGRASRSPPRRTAPSTRTRSPGRPPRSAARRFPATRGRSRSPRPVAAATTPRTMTSTGTASTTTAASNLAGSLSGNEFYAVAKGSVVYLARTDTGHDAFAATASITPGASASQGTATTHTVTLGGPVYKDDVWTLSLAGTPLTPFPVASSSTDASAVVTDFTTKAQGETEYVAFALGNVVYISKLTTGAWLPSVAIQRDPSAPKAIASGILKDRYVEDVELLPAGATADAGDTWTITIVGGATIPPITTTAAGVADAVNKLVALLGAYNASRDTSTNHLLLNSSTFAALNILAGPAAAPRGVLHLRRSHDVRARERGHRERRLVQRRTSATSTCGSPGGS